MQLHIKLSDRVWREQRFFPALIDKMPITLGFDLPVYDHETDVYALRSQLPSHALGERTQAEFWNCQVGEASAAAHCSSCTGKDDRPVPSFGHAPCGSLPDEQASEAADAPATLEVGRVDIENVVFLEGACVENDQVRLPKVAVHAVEDTLNIFAVRDISGVGASTIASFRFDYGA